MNNRLYTAGFIVFVSFGASWLFAYTAADVLIITQVLTVALLTGVKNGSQ